MCTPYMCIPRWLIIISLVLSAMGISWQELNMDPQKAQQTDCGTWTDSADNTMENEFSYVLCENDPGVLVDDIAETIANNPSHNPKFNLTEARLFKYLVNRADPDIATMTHCGEDSHLLPDGTCSR